MPSSERAHIIGVVRVKDEMKKDNSDLPENVIRISNFKPKGFYVGCAVRLFNEEPKFSTVVLSGLGSAVSTVVLVAEYVKGHVPGLHQITDISSETLMAKHENIEDKGNTTQVEHHISHIRITLSTNALDTTHVGYQAPLSEEEFKKRESERPSRERGDARDRTRERGGRGSRGMARGNRNHE